jgi:ribosomal protein L37E
MTLPSLRPYVQTRWSCAACGFFETWTTTVIHSFRCLKCGHPAYKMPGESCSGFTSRSLPFVNKPRKDKTLEAEYTFSEKATTIQRRKRN